MNNVKTNNRPATYDMSNKCVARIYNDMGKIIGRIYDHGMYFQAKVYGKMRPEFFISMDNAATFTSKSIGREIMYG